MAAAAELSRPCVSDRSLEQSCSPNLSQEVLFEVFRSLHTLAGQVSDACGSRGTGTTRPLLFPLAEPGGGAGAGEPGPRRPAEAPAERVRPGGAQPGGRSAGGRTPRSGPEAG